MTSISYLLTVHNEATELLRLFNQVSEMVTNNGMIDEVVVLDDFSTDQATIDLLEKLKSISFVKVVQHALNNDFGAHKTFGSRQCSKEFILQLDADEYLSDFLKENLLQILEANDTVDLFWLPRVNIVRGITDEDIKRWGWRTTKFSELQNETIVNWPDRQGRLYRNSKDIFWSRRLHEIIAGHKNSCEFPLDPSYAIIHDKTIDRQRKQNEFYMTNFTRNENMGR